MSQESGIKFVFFGSSRFSEYVLDELKNADYFPVLDINSAKGPLPELPDADVFIVASFGKILPKEVLELPKYGCINIHPSLLPELRGPSPIQNTILQNTPPGITIIKMDEKMDHGPILAQEKVAVEPWPDHYEVVEEKLGRAGGRLLTQVLPVWIESKVEAKPQDDSKATYTKLIKTGDALINLDDAPEINLRKIFAYSTSPGAYFFHKRKDGKEMRVVVKDAKIENSPPAEPGRAGKLKILSVIPAGKKEMDWESFLRGNA